jgi:hypothetical protein
VSIVHEHFVQVTKLPITRLTQTSLYSQNRPLAHSLLDSKIMHSYKFFIGVIFNGQNGTNSSKSNMKKQKLKSVNYVQQYNYIMNYNNIDHYLTAHFKCKLFQHVIIYVWQYIQPHQYLYNNTLSSAIYCKCSCFNSNVSNLYNNDVIKKSLKSCENSFIFEQVYLIFLLQHW